LRYNNAMGSIFDDLTSFISVDVEAAGPIPSQYALLSIGACTFTQPRRTFYVEIIPDKQKTDPGALSVHGLDMQTLMKEGLLPAQALHKFMIWLEDAVPSGQKPVMLAFNAPFDWMFIHEYFIRYLDRNPFGHSAVDIKAVYMGASGKSWQESSGVHLHQRYIHGKPLSHNALDDAIDQAEIFEGILKEFYTPENHRE
jgi:ribonuclease T